MTSISLLKSQYKFLFHTGGIRRIWDHWYENVLFDLKHGVDTASWLPVEEFPKGLDNLDHGVRYRASYTSEVRRSIDQALVFLKEKGYEEKDIRFTDIGCGKGKVLVQVAKEYGFKSVTGIDYNLDFLKTAKKNFEKAKVSNVELMHGDATGYDCFNGVNVVYLYNPFDEVILSQVIQNICKSNSKTVLIYNKPVHADAFRTDMGWRLLEDKKGWSPDWETKQFQFGFHDFHSKPLNQKLAA